MGKKERETALWAINITTAALALIKVVKSMFPKKRKHKPPERDENDRNRIHDLNRR